MNLEQWQTIWFQAIARAWSDINFKSELLGDAHGTLAKHFDCQIPDSVKLVIVENEAPDVRAQGGDTMFLTLPPKPAGMAHYSVGMASPVEHPKPCNPCGDACCC